MKSRTTPSFRKQFAALPQEVRAQASAAYEMFVASPRHPSLHFKKVHTTEPIVSVRVGRNYRAVGYIEEGDTVVWFWIGPHGEYEKVLKGR